MKRFISIGLIVILVVSLTGIAFAGGHGRGYGNHSHNDFNRGFNRTAGQLLGAAVGIAAIGAAAGIVGAIVNPFYPNYRTAPAYSGGYYAPTPHPAIYPGSYRTSVVPICTSREIRTFYTCNDYECWDEPYTVKRSAPCY